VPKSRSNCRISHSSSRRCGALALACLCGLASPAFGAEKNLPVPRFVTLRSDHVNLRTGPGERFPIDWVFTRRDMPVEIVEEFENWRKIQDAEGTVGWVHERMVKGNRTVLIRSETRALRDAPQASAGIVARAEPGVIAKLLECRNDWCRVEAGGVKGWLHRAELWGVFPNEVIE
jgi:SH3-like domain-containing protein